ncbi:hypothetical protein FBY30_2771 [Arthrobacter sp. SLBN-83]|uniref:hypothetical protein n=1 Tax=Arthrobacter sp. SLBN-83 TaxID=2768449 RepID=UPI00114D75D7|nr:hypothetical protein [Arthrobacter sp. SLBN-83]TQJ60503.1 hypothetical protein FBY30_2771 [Arthrobacter sp. SLBN-83]
MKGWFRALRWERRRPAPAPRPRISPEDKMIAAWWGYTEQQWAELPALVQVDKRETVTWARTA